VSVIATGTGPVAHRLPPEEAVLELLVVIIIVVLVLADAGGPLLAMRNPAVADKLTRGADRC
jgi:hypothetical protein